jgi:hypothetical protein
MHKQTFSHSHNFSLTSTQREFTFDEIQSQYNDLQKTSNEIVFGAYQATDQERRDLAHWALKLCKRDELYPVQKSIALVHAGAAFADSGYRRYVQGLIADNLEHTGENLRWFHDGIAETWRKIDSNIQASSIAAVNLRSQIEVEERHGHYQDKSYEHIMKVMYEEKQRQQKATEAAQKAKAIANSTTYDADSAAYNPFADERDEDLMRTA